MAKDKKSVLIYVDWINIFNELSNEEAGKLIKHFFMYVNDLNPEAPDRLTKLLFEPIKQTLKRDLVKYEDKRKKNRLNALLRWERENANACERTKTDAKHADSVSDSVSDSDKDINKEEQREIDKTWLKWKDYKKKEFRFSYKSEVSEQAAKNELINLSGGDEKTAIKIIEQSIANGWKGFFKLKINGTNKKPVGASNEAVARIIAEQFGSDANVSLQGDIINTMRH